MSSLDGFDDYRDGLLHGWLRVLTALGYTLIPLFFVLDFFMMPAELLPRFAIYRGAVTAAVLGQYFIVRWSRPTRYSYVHGYIFSTLVAAMIVQMTLDLGGFSSTYYAGLNLVIVAVNLLLPWRWVHSAINGVLIITVYIAANAVFGPRADVKEIVNNLYFMGGTVIISVALTQVRVRLITEEFRLRQDLLATNLSLDHSRAELKAARDALWGEMEMAKRIQTALLPADRRLGRYQVAAVMHTAAEVGGDYYDLISTPIGESWIAIGDVSGHGVESGLVMMMTQTAISTLVQRLPQAGPAAIFNAVNRPLHQNVERLGHGHFMTLNIVRLHDRGLVLAGKHQDVLVWRSSSRQVETVSNDGCWIAVVDDTEGRVADVEIPIGPGDVVLFFTDGATEAQNDAGEMFGQERLTEVFAACADRALEEVLDTLWSRVSSWQPNPADDVTFVIARADG